MTQDGAVSDTHAIRAVLAGRRDDFGVLVRRYFPAMVALAFSTTGSYADAEDIAQESFVQAYRHLDALKDPARFGVWLAAIVKNVARTFLAKRAKRAEVLTPTPRRAASDSSVEQREIHAFLRREMGRLHETFRDVLLLHYFAGLSAREIADVLNISRNAVLKRLERGRQALGRRLVDALGQGLKPGEGRLARKATQVMVAVSGAKVAWVPAGQATHTAVASHGALQVLRTATVNFKAMTTIGISAGIACLAIIAATGGLAKSPTEGKAFGFTVPKESPEPVGVPKTSDATSPNDADDDLHIPVSGPNPKKGAEPTGQISPALSATHLLYANTPVPESSLHPVQGVVYDPQGGPLPEAKVWAARSGFGAPDNRETVSDADGRFALRVPDGQWTLRAARGSFGGEADTDRRGEFIVDKKNDAIQTSIRTENRSLLRGRIFDKVSGESIPNGTLWTDTSMLVVADADGRFVIEGIRQEDHTFVTLCPGYVREYILYSTALRSEAELEVFLERGGKISGVVTDPQGRPAAYAWVWVVKSGASSVNGYFDVCDEQGHFEYDGVPLDREIFFEARRLYYINTCSAHQPERARWSGRVDANAPVPSLALHLSEGPVEEIRACSNESYQECDAVIRGRVVDPSGQPVRNFHVRLRLPRPSLPKDGGLEVHYDYPGVLFTSDDGTFAVATDREPGQEVDVVGSAEGYREARMERVPFKSAKALRPSDAITLHLGKPASLKVRVLDASTASQPIQGSRITVADPFWNAEGEALKVDWLDRESDRHHYAVTDGNGWASFEEVDFPDGLLRVEKDGFATACTPWDGRAPRVTVMLEKGAVVEGVALNEFGQGLTAPDLAPVLVLKGTLDGTFDPNDPNDVWREQTILPEDQGRFRITGLPPRHYELCISWTEKGRDTDGPAREFREYNDTFTLAPGQVLQVAYPRDDIRQSPERLLAEAQEMASPTDGALREQLIGTWTRQFDLPDSSRVVQVDYFGVDGEWWEILFRSSTTVSAPGGGYVDRPANTTAYSGWFTVAGGTVNMFDDVRGHTWFPSVEVRGSTLHVFGIEWCPDFRLSRADSIEAALRMAEQTCGVSRESRPFFATPRGTPPDSTQASRTASGFR